MLKWNGWDVMKLNDEVVVAEFDGGKIILIVDTSSVVDNRVVHARDLYGKSDYLVDKYSEKKQNSYRLNFHYFEVAKNGNLIPLYLYEEIISKYGLTVDCDVDDSVLLKIEDELNEPNLKETKKPGRR